MAALERKLKSSIFNDRAGNQLYLDELDPARGRHDDMDFECSLLCHVAERDIADAEAEEAA